MTALGVGLIGCGNISSAYLRLAPLFRDLDVRAVADIDMNAAQTRADQFDVDARTVDALLASDDIDVVVNLTIPAVHYQVTKSILEAGRHAYSEKPLVLTLKEGEDLRRIASASGLRIGSAPDTFLGGAHQQARAMIDGGEVGRIVTGTAHVMSRGMEHWHPNPDFFFKPGAGPMLDIGPYYVTNLIQLLGPVNHVMASATSASDSRTILSEPRKGETISVETPTTIHAILTFTSGAVITLGTSWDVKAHRHACMELYGTNGSLFVPDPNFFGGTLDISDADGTISEVAAWDHPFGRANQDLETNDPRANYRAAGLADMVAAIDADRPHRCSLELALHATEVMTGALASAESGTSYRMTTTCNRPKILLPEDAEALLS